MAKEQKTPVAPKFKDVDKEAASRAQAALAGGRQDPLKVPKTAAVSTDKNGVEYSRWNERLQITAAYRSVTKKGLMDVVVSGKIRQSSVKDNTGKRVFGHYYLNMASDIPETHEQMNDRSTGAIMTLLQATGFMPEGGTLKGSLLDKMFPEKGKPGTASPLNGKAAVGVIVQTLGPQKNLKTGKPILDEDGEPILEKRDGIEKFLPDAEPVEDDEDADEDDDEDVDDDDTDESDDDDAETDDDSDESDDDESDDEDSDDDEEEEEEDEDEDEDEEEEEEPVKAPVKKTSKPSKPSKPVKKTKRGK